MANPEHLAKLKEGVKAWNAWRDEHPNELPDLSETDLSNETLIAADLSDVDFSYADLSGSDLSQADLHEAKFRNATLYNTNLTEATLFYTYFVFVNLSTCKGLKTCSHHAPSSLDTHTLVMSENLPKVFLQECGLSDWEIEANKLYNPNLNNDQIIDIQQRIFEIRKNGTPIQFHSLFISYSTKDDPIAHKLHNDLQQAGVRCWFAPKDLPIGRKIRPGLNEAIQNHERTLLILSQDSMSSSWVEAEVETALEKEEEGSEEVLFPIRIDEEAFLTQNSLFKLIKRTTNIGDFSKWEDPIAYQESFDRLLRDLQQ